MAEDAELRLWWTGASDEHVEARRRLLAAERELCAHVERVAAERRELPPGPVCRDYTFAEGPRDLSAAGPVTAPSLADAFGEHDTLVVYHLMFSPGADEACPMCSMWVDGLHGVAHHLARHTALAVVAKAALPELRAWGAHRGWQGLRLLSAHDSSFAADAGFEDADGGQHPGMSVFTREGGTVRHRYSAQAAFSLAEGERGIDLYSPVWQVLDLLPQGRGTWYAGNSYAGATRG